jgi:hypothetical protein
MTEAIYIRNLRSNHLERVGASNNLMVVCLWAALGLAVTGLLFHVGFVSEITAALAVG